MRPSFLSTLAFLLGILSGEGLHLHRRQSIRRHLHGSVSLNGRALKSTEGERGDVREIGLLALPALVSQLTDPFLSVVDTAYCGRLGPSALASMGPCVSLFHLSFNTFGALRGTTTALIAGALAQSELDYQSDPTNAVGKRKAAQVAQVSLVLSLLLGSAVLVGLACFGSAALAAMGLPNGSALHGPASNYLRVRAVASPAFLALVAFEGIFRGHGNTRAPLVAALVCALVNLLLDPLLMFGPAPWLQLGLGGAAAASAVAQYAALGSYVWLQRRSRNIHLGTVALEKAEPWLKQTRNGNDISDDLGVVGTAAATTTDSVPSVNNATAGAAAPRTTGAVNPTPEAAIKASSSTVGLGQMLDQWRREALAAAPVAKQILSANGALLAKTSSLMLCWAVASKCATQMGEVHAAAHQVSLSIWLIMALACDAPGVAGQILSARFVGSNQYRRARMLVWRLLAVGIGCGSCLSCLLSGVVGIDRLAWMMAPNAPLVHAELMKTLPVVALQVPLVAATLALEGVLIGTGQFAWLASSMLVSTTLAAWLLTHASMVSEAFTGTTAAGVAGATAVAVAASAATTAGCISSGAVDLWRGGLSALFGLRFLAAALRLMDQTRGPLWSQEEKKAAARYRANPFF